MRLSGAFVCARKRPVRDRTAKSSFNRIVLDVASDPLLLLAAPNPTIEIIAAPEGACTAQQPIGLRRAGSLDARNDTRNFGQREQEDVNVVRHQDPTAEFIQASALPLQQASYYRLGHIPASKPLRTLLFRIKQPVEGDELCAFAGVLSRPLNPRQRSREPPRQKTRRARPVPMRQMAMTLHANTVASRPQNSLRLQKRA